MNNKIKKIINFISVSTPKEYFIAGRKLMAERKLVKQQYQEKQDIYPYPHLLMNIADWLDAPPGGNWPRPWAYWIYKHKPALWLWNMLLVKPARLLSCTIHGHYIVNSYMAKPKHRYCTICHKYCPYQKINDAEK